MYPATAWVQPKLNLLWLPIRAAEAAIVGYPHDIKGQGIYAYVTLNVGETPDEELHKELQQWVRSEIGPIASPDLLQWAPDLPKTRSGAKSCDVFYAKLPQMILPSWATY